MMSKSLKLNPAAAALTILLGACGGAGDGSTGNKMLPTEYTSEGRAMNSCSFSPGCSGVSTAPYFANLTAAPVGGATLSGIVRLEVRGNMMANVELLPATRFTPRRGVFNITGDQTVAWMDLDTRTLPNGTLNLRISAFNRPAGQPGATEIVAMPARAWTISNAATPPSSFTAAVTTAPANGAIVTGIKHLEVRGSQMANVELVPASGGTRLAVFNISADRTLASLDFDARSLPDGIKDVRISAYNVTQGQPGGTQITAMSTRRWDVRNGQVPAAPFIAAVTIAPPHGDLITGTARLELRGSGLRNVELLPAAGYTPILGTFLISADSTYAWLDLDTSTLPSGILNARISAFNVDAGQPNGKEIIAMPARQWDLRH